jgi:hypothetical protein
MQRDPVTLEKRVQARTQLESTVDRHDNLDEIAARVDQGRTDDRDQSVVSVIDVSDFKSLVVHFIYLTSNLIDSRRRGSCG